MATKIKALKCPNCGSEKHIDLGNKRFLCKSCGTEFYIDDDDITINVNHHIDFDGKSFDQSKKTMGIFAVAITVGTIILFFLFSIITLFSNHYDSINSSYLSGGDSINVE